MKNSYYIQISSNTLAHYLVCGCICPVSLLERRENDFQNNYPEQIILSRKKWNENSDCSIEVILNNTEDKYLEELSSDYLLYNSIIPISRIKTIFFLDKEKADAVIWNIENGASFVPKRLVMISEKNDYETADIIPLNNYLTKNSLEDLIVNLKRFDRLMGGLAFMRTSLFDIEDLNINYPINYFSTVAYFNNTIELEFLKTKNNYNQFLHSIFKGESDIFKYLALNININTVENIAKKEKISIQSKFGVINLNEIPKDSATFQLAILNTYGKDKSKSVEDLLSVLFNELETEKKEEIALIYGLYVGYTSLRNYYKLNGRDVTVKFKLDSKVDYYIVESLFQYAFNHRTISENFDYLNPILPLKNKISIPLDYKVDYLLEETIITKKKDYSQALKNMVKLMSNEILNWFPTNIFKVDTNAIEKKMESIIKLEFDALIQEVKFDSKMEFKNENAEKENEKTIQSKLDEDKILKENKVSFSVEIPAELNDINNIEEINTNELNNPTAFDFDKMNLKDLKEYAKKSSIKIPTKMNKEDIIKLLLSNPNIELGL